MIAKIAKRLSNTDPILSLAHPPIFVLIKMQSTRVPTLPDLNKGVIPLSPVKRTPTIREGNQNTTVTRKQFPLTTSYTFTGGYRSQGKTINDGITDIASPPSGGMTRVTSTDCCILHVMFDGSHDANLMGH